MQGKTVLITGGNDGIGKWTAIGLAKMGAEVVIACRNRSKAEKAVVEIRNKSGNPNIKAFPCDLSSFESVRQLANQFQSVYDQLDVLINNAGLFTSQLEYSREGFELQFGVNHLGHFLLTQLLLPQLQNATKARLVNVASHGHYYGAIDFDNLRGEKGAAQYNGWSAYAQSKLANVLFTREFARRFPTITANVLHPGAIRTNIGVKHANWYTSLFWNALKILMRSQSQGAQTSIYLASSPEVANLTGLYFDDDQKQKYPSRVAQDDALAQKLWEVSAQLIQPFYKA